MVWRWNRTNWHPASRIVRAAASPISRPPLLSTSTRTCNPSRARAANASLSRVPSVPAFQRNVSKWIDERARAISSNRVSKKAPFSRISMPLPPISCACVRPATDGSRISIGSSTVTGGLGSRWRLMLYRTKASTTMASTPTITIGSGTGTRANSRSAIIAGLPVASRRSGWFSAKDGSEDPEARCPRLVLVVAHPSVWLTAQRTTDVSLSTATPRHR